MLVSALTEQVQRIPLDKIRESVVTLRTQYDEEALTELGESIAECGQIQTIVVQPSDGDSFDLIIGSRRFRAAGRAGMHDIAAYVIQKRSPVQLLFIALAENLHRADLNPFEEAQIFLRLTKEHQLDVKRIAKGIHKPESYVRSRLQLLSMPEEVATFVSEKKLGLHYIPALARLPSGEDQVRLAHSVMRDRLTEPELRAQIAQELREPSRKERASYELTVVKVQARLGEFTGFLQKIPRRMNLRRMNASERQGILKALQVLDEEVRSLREVIRGNQSSTSFPLDPARDPKAPGNHGQEWTMRDIQRINSPRRPSDEVLSEELGRTVGSIKAMRAQTREKTKRAN